MPPYDSYLRRGALLMGAVTVAGYLVDYAFNLGLTRFLDPHAYGDFKVAYSFAFFFGLAVLLGGDRAAPMILAPSLERGETTRVWEYLRFYLINGLALGLGVVAVTWTLSALHIGSSDPHDHHPFAWAVVGVPINVVATLASRTMQAAQRPASAAVPWRIGLPLLQLALFGLVVSVNGTLTASQAIVIAVVSIAVIAAWQWREVRRLGLVELQREPSMRQPKGWLAASLPMMGTFLVALALNQSDLYFLEFLGDESEVGHYAAASMAAHFVPLIQVALIGLIAPIVGPAIHKGADASRTAFRQTQLMMLAAVTPIALLLAVAGQPVLALFGPQYEVGRATLQLLLLGNFTWAAAALPSLWLQYEKRAGAVLAISIATLVLDSVLNLLLIPRYGMNGAAGGTAATLSLAALMIVVVYWRSRD